MYAWIVTRLAVLVVMATVESNVRGDVAYYQQSFSRLREIGLDATLVEYPVPAAGLLGVPALLGDSQGAYAQQFLLLIAALDVAVLVMLFRADGRRRGPATDFWLLVVPLVGPIAFNRFDLVPAALVAAAVLVAARCPAVAGALVAAGAAVKLWPAVLYPVLLARRGHRSAVTAGFLVTGGALALASLAAGGFDRLVSPLTWQSDRGLQVESVWSTPVAVARALGVGGIETTYSDYNAWEITGRGVGSMLVLADLATMLGLVVIGALCLRAARAATIGPEVVATLVVAVAAIVIATSKTFSPQYLLWLAGAVAAALALAHDPEIAAKVRRVAALTLAMAVLGQLVYPITYRALLDLHGAWALAGATGLLAARNILLVAATVGATRLAWRATAPAGSYSANR